MRISDCSDVCSSDLIDKYGPAAIMRVGLGLFAVGFIAFSQIQNLWMFYAAFTLMAVGSSLGGFLSVTVAVVNWFDRARSRALGVSQLGDRKSTRLNSSH